MTQPSYSSGSLLDVVICNSSDIIQRVHASKCAFSPHHFIRVFLRLPKSHKKPVLVSIRLLKRVDQFSLTSDLHIVDWSGVFSGSSVSEKILRHQLFITCSRLTCPAENSDHT